MTSTPISVCFLILFYLYFKPIPVLSRDDGNHLFYNGFSGANFHLDGGAKIHSNGLLQLTSTAKQQTGHAFYNLPLKFNKSSAHSLSFSTHFVFAIVPEIRKISGHGMAFTISPSMDFSQASPTQYLGLFNISNYGLSSNHVLAIELDTVVNPEFRDINDNHVGVDLNGLKSIVSAPAAYYSDREGKNKSLELISGDPMQVWIDYDPAEFLLNVTLAPIKSPKPSQPLLSTHINLSHVLLDSMYVGFSASTGSIASNHYLLGWSFNRSGPAQSLQLSNLPSFPQGGKAKEKRSLDIKIFLVVIFILLIIMAAGIGYFVRRKKFEEIREDWEVEYGPQRFCFKELYKATKGFKDRELLGSGGFGKVYKGVLPSSKAEVAVKKIAHDSRQGMKEFVSEIASLGRLRHRSLVRLLGYCRRKGELLLVYDYMPHGSLDKFLFTNEKPNLSWSQRLCILRGVASALLYLHEEWEQVVLHRDLKASNVLLDGDLNGRLGDFGLARSHERGSNPETTHLVGTIGYLAPEVSRTGKASASSDVFAFGAFLLEVACGRRPIKVQGLPEEMVLVDWVFVSWKRGAILETSDPRLRGDFPTEEMELVLKLGLLCSHTDPALRPSMRQVVQYLDGNAELSNILIDGSDQIDTIEMGNENSVEFVSTIPSSIQEGSYSASSSESILRVYESVQAPDASKETARQHPRAITVIPEKHFLPNSVNNEAEQEKQSNPPSPNKRITKTQSSKFGPAYAAVTDAPQAIASKIEGLNVAPPTVDASQKKLDRVSRQENENNSETESEEQHETQTVPPKVAGMMSVATPAVTDYAVSGGGGGTGEHLTSGQQNWDKGVSVKEYLMQKLEPGKDERALSQVITEAISPRKTPGDMGVVDKVREAVTSLLRSSDQSSQSTTETTNSSLSAPVSAHSQRVTEEESHGRILQAN